MNARNPSFSIMTLYGTYEAATRDILKFSVLFWRTRDGALYTYARTNHARPPQNDVERRRLKDCSFTSFPSISSYKNATNSAYKNVQCR